MSYYPKIKYDWGQETIYYKGLEIKKEHYIKGGGEITKETFRIGYFINGELFGLIHINGCYDPISDSGLDQIEEKRIMDFIDNLYKGLKEDKDRENEQAKRYKIIDVLFSK